MSFARAADRAIHEVFTLSANSPRAAAALSKFQSLPCTLRMLPQSSGANGMHDFKLKVLVADDFKAGPRRLQSDLRAFDRFRSTWSRPRTASNAADALEPRRHPSGVHRRQHARDERHGGGRQGAHRRQQDLRDADVGECEPAPHAARPAAAGLRVPRQAVHDRTGDGDPEDLLPRHRAEQRARGRRLRRRCGASSRRCSPTASSTST